MTLAAVKKKKSRRLIGWNNRSQPFGERLYRAIEYLGFRAKNSNAIAACETLEKIVSEQQKYRLYQKFFPEEWASSRASLFKTGYYEQYSERTNEFFELVNKNLFPFLEGWCYDPEMELENFYIFSPNLDLCCEEFEYENLRISYVAGLLFYLDGDEIWEHFNAHYGLDRGDFPEISTRPDENLWRLEKTGKIELYLNLFELIDHSTGNPWLDTINCQGGEWYGWDEQTINFLAESHKDALDILEKTSLLDGLVEANPKDVLLDLITLWNEGHLPEQEN
jgi:hypothetical protein